MATCSFYLKMCFQETAYYFITLTKENTWQIKKWFLCIYFIYLFIYYYYYSFGGRDFLRISLKYLMVQSKGKNKKSFVFIISLSLCEAAKYGYYLCCHVITIHSKYIWELTLIITQSLDTVLFVNCLLPQNNLNIFVTQGEGGTQPLTLFYTFIWYHFYRRCASSFVDHSLQKGTHLQFYLRIQNPF